MTDDQKYTDQQASQPRHVDRPADSRIDSEGGSPQRNKNRRPGASGGGKKGVYRYEDQREHDICQLVTHRAPQGFPVIGRSDLATRPPVEVARTEHRILMCDGMHTGPHRWPNGDEIL